MTYRLGVDVGDGRGHRRVVRVSTSGCVRASATDVHASNLTDLDAKYADAGSPSATARFSAGE